MLRQISHGVSVLLTVVLLTACSGDGQPQTPNPAAPPTTATRQPTELPPTATTGATTPNTPRPEPTAIQQATLAPTATTPPPTATTPPPTSGAQPAWTLTAESDAVGPGGVSPEAILLDDGRVRLYVTAMGIEVWESADGISFEQVAARTPPGADPTLVRTESGWRMYYTEIPPEGPDSGKRNIRTATSSNGLDWIIEAETGIAQESDHRAWGVPDTYVLADGRVRLMWTDKVPGQRDEVLRSATSTDGITFTPDEGLRLSGGFVDSYVLSETVGTMLVSTSPPGRPGVGAQRLFLATSQDGLIWTAADAPLLDRSPRNALDPTAVSLGAGYWRVYYTLTDGPNPFDGFRIASAILKSPTAEGSTPEATTAAQPSAATDASTSPGPCIAKETGMPDRTEQDIIYFHQIYRAFSSDAFNFTPENVLLLDHASVPDAVVGPDGETWVYYVNGEAAQHGIWAARQNAAGEWEAIDCVRIDGQFNGNAVDPDIVRLPDGRYRLFFYEGFFTTPVPQDAGDHPIFSAISGDGLNFTLEQQLVALEDVTDPSAVRLPDGSWLLALPQKGETLVLPSADGFNFDPAGIVRLSPGGIPELAALPDGRVRLFYAIGGGIGSYISSDNGQTWQAESGLRINKPVGEEIAADPSLLALPDGSYELYYKTTVVVPMGTPDGQPAPGRPPAPPGEQPPPPAEG